MKIIIIGAGTVGLSLVEYFSSIGKNQITVIDQDQDLIDEVSTKFDVFTIVGSGTSPAVLERAGTANAEMIIAVTPSDEANLLICHFAKQLGVAKRIARIVSNDYDDEHTSLSLFELGVTHVIQPEIEIVSNIVQYIELPGVTESANFQADNVFLRGYRITSDMPIANKMLSEIALLAGDAQILIVLIIRGGKTILPTGNEQILPGDEIIAIMPDESLESFRKLINRGDIKIRKVVIFGDSLTTLHLADAIQSIADRTILVDPNEEHGRNAACILNNTEVIHGDCTNVEILQEVGIRDATFFIAAGTDSEDNIMASLLAKAEGAHSVIAVTTNIRHSRLFHSLGIDYIINPQTITTQKIIENILRLPIGSLLTIRNANVRVTRFIAGKESPIVGKPLSALAHLTNKAIVFGSIFRNETAIIPSGKTIIEENDEVLIICSPENLKTAGKLFASE